MYANDENSGPSIRKGKRRSSILKIPKSPGYVLDDIDPNAENVEETAQKPKKARRSSSRRVSFAETCQVKEIPNKVLEKMNPDDSTINEDTSVPPSFLNLESTRDNSVYRPAASTLAGLPSLLTSPIQESPPQRSSFRELSPDDGENQLDFTQFDQSTVLTSRYSVSNKCSHEEDDGQLDFTRSHGAYIQDNRIHTTVPQDMLEMTANYEGWEFEQSTVLTRQVVASKVAISNREQMQKLNASNFLDQLNPVKANASSENFERRNSYDTFQTSRNVQCPKIDGTSFLSQLRTSNNSSFQPQRQRDTFSNPSLTEAHSTTFPITNTFAQSPKIDQSSFLSQLSNSNPSFPQSNLHSTMMRKEDNLDFTQCVGNGIQGARLKTSYGNDDVTSNEMEMTANYGNWMESATPAAAKNNHSLGGQRSLQTNNDLDFTRCHGGNMEPFPYQHYDDADRTANQMEMTRNYQNWVEQQTYMAPLQRNDISHKRSPEKGDNLEFTRCHAGNIETAQFQTVDEDITVNMEMTRNYENWEQEKPNMNSVQLKTPRNDNNLHFINKRSPEKDDNLEFTRCQAGRIEFSQSGTVYEDVGAQQMEMTRNYENWEEEKSHMIPASRNDSTFRSRNKRSPEKGDNLEFTRCQAGHIEISQSGTVDEGVAGNQMEMTRNYENWEQDKSMEPRTPMNANNFVHKVSEKISDVPPNRLGDDLDRTASEKINALRDVDMPATQTSMPIMVNASSLEELSGNQTSLVNVSRQLKMTENQTSTKPMANASRIDEFSGNQTSFTNVSRQLKMSEKQTSTKPMVNASRLEELSGNQTSLMNVSRRLKLTENQTSTKPMVNASRIEELSGNQTSLMNVSRQLKLTENQTSTKSMVNASRHVEIAGNATPKVARREEVSETQKSTMNVSRFIEMSGNQTSMMNTKRHLEISENQTSLVKAVPRAKSSKMTIMDKNFQRFEIKMPTSRTSKIPVFKSKEKHPAIKSEEKPSKLQVGINVGSEAPSSCAQDVTITTTTSGQLSHVVDVGKHKQEEMKTSPTVVIDEQENADSTTVVNLSTKSIEPDPNNTIAKTEHFETEMPECKRESIPEEKPREAAPQEPYTLRKFMDDAGIGFIQLVTRRSETPMLRSNIPKDLKDKIYSRCLSEAKLEIMEDFAQQLQKGIAENEKLFAAKAKELDANNPPVFAKLMKVLGTENEDLVVDVIMRLKRTGETRGKRLLYNRKKEMRKDILASLQEQEKKLSSELSLINQHKSELDEDISMLDKVEADCDKQILELEATLGSEEKEWAEYVEDTNELKHKLETIELELKSKEEERASLSSVKESLTSEIAEQKRKTTDLESAIEKLAEEKTLRKSKDEEIRKFLPFQTALQEWVLEKHDETKFKFVFLGRTLDLDVTFEDGEKMKDIQLSSQISEISIPLAILGHKLIIEKFAQYDFLAMFPTRKKVLQLLHQVSVACIRVRLLLETMTKFSINHIVFVNDKILTVEFSSLSKFMKFILNVDLSKLVTDGDISFTVVRKIGTTSAEAITEEINKFPSTVTYLSKILETADQMMR